MTNTRNKKTNPVSQGLLYLVLICVAQLHAQTQPSVIDSLSGHKDKLVALMEYKRATHDHLEVLQIGDSHIQPGVMTEPLAYLLQNEFGDGGYGLAFPFQVAQTNGHGGYQTFSNMPWTTAKVIQEKPNSPIGISGYTITNKSAESTITWEFDSLVGGNEVQWVKIFHASIMDSNFHYQLVNDRNETAQRIASLSNAHSTVFYFAHPTFVFELRHEQFYEKQKSSTIYGVYVANDQKGARVSSVGVNGATYKHYAQSIEFRHQLDQLQPDLIILSLGTNEAFQSNFDDTLFFDEVLNLVQMMQSLESHPVVILSTPPAVSIRKSSGKKGYYAPNPIVPRVRDVIIDVADRLEIPVYDLYAAMGGANSMKNWSQLGMTDKRQIHFSPKGYKILGESMAKAIKVHIPFAKQ